MNTDSSVVLCNLRLLPRKTSLFRVSSTLGLFGLPKKHRRGAENTEFLCAPAVSRGILRKPVYRSAATGSAVNWPGCEPISSTVPTTFPPAAFTVSVPLKL